MKKILAALCLLFACSHPALAINVTTIAVAAQTVTVTTPSAHGFAVNTGVCFSAPATVCTAVRTVPTTTTFTFLQPSNVTVAACASSCGTVIAAPKIIVLDVGTPNQAQQTIHYVMWLTTIIPLPHAGATSQWTAGAGSVGASAPQIAALSAGSFLELERNETFPASLTTGQLQTFLENDYTTQQAAKVANIQPGALYGSVWNGATWVTQ